MKKEDIANILSMSEKMYCEVNAMVNTAKNMLLYLFVLFVDFYILPLFMMNTGTAMILLLAVMPGICAGCSLLYGLRHGFHIAYPVLAAALFIPTVYIHYNSSAWVYTAAFGAAALFGDGLGALIRKTRAASTDV